MKSRWDVEPEIGVVVPTLGIRPAFLIECLGSIRQNEQCHVVLVRPTSSSSIDDLAAGLVDQVIDDPELGLAAAINTGICAMPSSVKFASWLGDDDRLHSDSLNRAATCLRRDSKAVLAFGRCQYIDAGGQAVWLNRSGKWTVPLLSFGPQLIPQPGSLFRKSTFDLVGQLDESLKWAFDLDLFTKLRKKGKFAYIPEILADFRWHDDSLSVGSRRGSVEEASRVRVKHLPKPAAKLSFLWEPVLRRIILKAGERLSTRQ